MCVLLSVVPKLFLHNLTMQYRFSSGMMVTVSFLSCKINHACNRTNHKCDDNCQTNCAIAWNHWEGRGGAGECACHIQIIELLLILNYDIFDIKCLLNTCNSHVLINMIERWLLLVAIFYKRRFKHTFRHRYIYNNTQFLDQLKTEMRECEKGTASILFALKWTGIVRHFTCDQCQHWALQIQMKKSKTINVAL